MNLMYTTALLVYLGVCPLLQQNSSIKPSSVSLLIKFKGLYL